MALRTRDGKAINVAALPFLSHRYAVRAAEVLLHDFSEHALDYARQVAAMVTVLTEGFTPDAVNVVMAHATLLGGRRGGGERDVQTSLGYELPASIFPATAHYAALGHLHRCQEISGPCPIFYSGSPLAIDFGEQDNTSVVCVVEARPTVPARVTDIPITSGRRLRTVRGTLAELEAQAASFGDDYLRVWLRERTRAGLREDTVAILPNALEVRIDPAFAEPSRTQRPETADAIRSPGQLFADYCASVQVEDTRFNYRRPAEGEQLAS